MALNWCTAEIELLKQLSVQQKVLTRFLQYPPKYRDFWQTLKNSQFWKWLLHPPPPLHPRQKNKKQKTKQKKKQKKKNKKKNTCKWPIPKKKKKKKKKIATFPPNPQK